MKNEQQKIAKKRYTFKPALEKIPLGLVANVKKELWSVLQINNRTSWNNKLKGIVSPRIETIEGVQQVFIRYGITDCWTIEAIL